jgi:hypothetical protein
MKAADFKRISEDSQRKIVADKGVMLSVLEWGNYRIFLFQVDGFYVEYFFSMSTNELAWTTVFDDTNMLSKYLEEIDITSIIP